MVLIKFHGYSVSIMSKVHLLNLGNIHKRNASFSSHFLTNQRYVNVLDKPYLLNSTVK